MIIKTAATRSAGRGRREIAKIWFQLLAQWARFFLNGALRAGYWKLLVVATRARVPNLSRHKHS